jgi:TetR/AcrR family transcriptional repressor of nem operon
MRQECDTRQKLLGAATKLMWENSYGSVSVDDICVRAGVRKGSFYYFFPSKCDLTVAAFEDLWQQKQHTYDQIFSPLVPPLERLVNHCQSILESQRQKFEEYGKVCGCPYFTLGAEMSTQEEKIRLKIEEMAARFRRYYESTLYELLQDGLIAPADPAVKAQEMLSFLMGALLQAKVSNSLVPLHNLSAGVFRLLGITEEALRSEGRSSQPDEMELSTASACEA